MAKRIDPVKLSRFSTIVKEGGFSRAAEKLCITQPALSQSMAQFEDELGLKLFEPGRRGGVPTVYGACLLGYADTIRLQLDRAAEHIERLANGRHGVLNVGTLSGAAVSLASQAICRLQSAAPDMAINLLAERSAETLIFKMRNREYDLAICHSPTVPHGKEIKTIPVYATERVIVTRRDHPIAKQKKHDLKDFLKYSFTCPSNDLGLLEAIQTVFVKSDLAFPTTNILHSNSVSAARQILLNSDSFAVMSDLTIKTEFRDDEVDYYPLNFPTKYWYLIHIRQEQELTPDIAAFIEELSKVCRAQNIEVDPDLSAGRVDRNFRKAG